MTTETLNLLPPERRGMLRLQRRLHVWALAAAGYGVVALGACFALATGEPTVDRHEAHELAEIIQETDGYKEQDAKNKKELQKEKINKQSSDVVADHPDWSILLDLLADQRGQDVVLESVSVSPLLPPSSSAADKGDGKGGGAAAERPGAFVVRLSGFARSQMEVTNFADRLQKTGAFESVSLVQTNARAAETIQLVEYLIQCQIGETPAAPKEEPKP